LAKSYKTRADKHYSSLVKINEMLDLSNKFSIELKQVKTPEEIDKLHKKFQEQIDGKSMNDN